MTHGQASLALIATIVSAAIYLVLASVLHVREPWAGFLFLAQWGLMEQAKVERLPPSILGAFTGLILGALLIWLPPLIGATPGLVVAVVVILAAVYALNVGWAPMMINAATMIFLTVVTIPHIAQSGRTNEVFVGLAYGVVFFGGLAWAASRFLGKTKPIPGPAAEPVVTPHSPAL